LCVRYGHGYLVKIVFDRQSTDRDILPQSMTIRVSSMVSLRGIIGVTDTFVF